MNMNNEVLEIALADIIPNQFQPRMNFDEKELEELAASIKEHGIIQPLVLRKMGVKYEIIAGERRYRAAGMAGLTKVPAIISNIDDQTSAEVALVENVQRKDLTAIEEARSYKNLLDKGYLTQEQLAKKMGLSQPAIANKLRLLNLDESVQQALLNNQISERHARSLLAISDKEQQKKWLNRIISERLTVRQLDIEIKKEQEGKSDNDIPIISLTKDVDTIKNNASDIKMSTNTSNTYIPPVQPVNIPSSTGQKNENKFFNFLEDEAVNMNTSLDNSASIFNSTPDIPVINSTPVEPKTENKFINFNIPQNNNEVLISDSISNVEEKKVESELETLFDPMDQVELLDPNYEEKQKEESGLDLKTAINQTRETIDDLKNKGFNVELEELDLDNKYQIIIKIDK